MDWIGLDELEGICCYFVVAGWKKRQAWLLRSVGKVPKE